MPLTEKGKKIKASMVRQYGAKKGESVFYASANKGTITGVHDETCDCADCMSARDAVGTKAAWSHCTVCKKDIPLKELGKHAREVHGHGAKPAKDLSLPKRRPPEPTLNEASMAAAVKAGQVLNHDADHFPATSKTLASVNDANREFYRAK